MIRTPLLWQTIGLSRSSYPFSEYTEPCLPARPGASSEEGHSSLDIYPSWLGVQSLITGSTARGK